jgi:hypothetical protein
MGLGVGVSNRLHKDRIHGRKYIVLKNGLVTGNRLQETVSAWVEICSTKEILFRNKTMQKYRSDWQEMDMAQRILARNRI